MEAACRACASREMLEVLDMGPLPLAGDFRPQGEVNQRYPLAIDRCERCGLLQVRDMVPAEVIFNAGYSYASSTVPGLVRHFERFAADVALQAGQRRRLLEIGCNDGVFLSPLTEVGYEVVGIDASDNVAAMARGRGLDVRTGFFGSGTAQALAGDRAPYDVVTCSNVFAHDPDPNGFLEAARSLLTDEGEIWIEVHSGRRLHDELQWDCFYHEHIFYWTIHSIVRIMREHGLALRHWSVTPMHGGALRVAFARGGRAVEPEEPELSRDDWIRFGASCRRSRGLIRDAITSLPIDHAYGAAGRAVTLINWTEIGSILRFVVDGSPLRYGRAIPGTTVPVTAEAAYLDGEAPDWCFVTAHNYLADIRRKVEGAFPGRLIRFVTPLPNVMIS